MLAAGWLLWLLSRAGWRISGWEGALLAMAAFGLNVVTPRLATLVRTDMVLALFITLAGLLIYRKLRSGTAWTTAERWQIFAAVLGSMLTKGPIAYAFLLPGLVAFWWLQRRRVSPAVAWSGWWSWFGPLLFFGAWAGAGLALSPEFYDQVVRREFLGRFTVGEAAVHNNQPVYFYVLHLLRDFFPWSILVIAMGCIRDVRERIRRDPALLWLVCWAVGGLVVMSLVPSKRGDRVFPIYPPLCLLLAAMGSMLPAEFIGRWRVPAVSRTLAAILLAAISAGGYAGYKAVESFRQHDGALTAFGAAVRQLPRADRLAVVTGKDEGLLLYLDQRRFTRWDDAVELWKRGEIDFLVAPVKYANDARRQLPDAKVALESHPDAKKNSRYLCLQRTP
jgi:4-amino-4-deoxy-L-arabinose transferase-like glycosyltransferase